MKKGNNLNKIIIAIVALVLLIAGAGFGLIHSQYASVKKAEQEAKAQQEAQFKAEQEAAKKQEAEEAEAAEAAKVERSKDAEHVIYYGATADGKNGQTIEAFDSAIADGAYNIRMAATLIDGTLYVTEGDSKDLKLADAFDKYKNSIDYVVDLKSESSDAAQELKKLIDEHSLKDNVSVMCGALQPLKDLEEPYPDMQKIYTASSQSAYDLGLQRDYVDTVAVTPDLMSQYLCNGAHEWKTKFCVRTIETEEQFKNAISYGVDSYFTDEPKLAISTEKENR